MLKNSARNCRCMRSEIAVVFNTEASRVATPGPISVLRPTFPYVPAGGTTNAAGLKYWFGVPGINAPLKSGFQEGRTGLRLSPSPEGLNPRAGVKGKPV